jgi:hypothetical protein
MGLEGARCVFRCLFFLIGPREEELRVGGVAGVINLKGARGSRGGRIVGRGREAGGAKGSG